jgi:hypothetical protein
MTHALDIGDRLPLPDRPDAMGAPLSASRKRGRFRTFAITFGIAFTLLYTVLERLNWPLFTYQPAVSKVYFWLHRPLSGEGPPMYWYGWIVNAAIAALLLGWIATRVSAQWLRRATVFCCVLAGLWPAILTGLRFYIVKVATFDADFLDSIWIAGAPALLATAAITYFVPARLIERVWTSWLLIVPIVGLVVLGNSLMQYFVR